MRYSFKFESLLNYKKRLEEVAQQVLAQRMTKLVEAENKLTRLKTQEEEYLLDLVKKRTEGIYAARYLLYINFLDSLAKNIDRQEAIVRELRQAASEARQRLLQLSRERKVVEKLKEKDFDAFGKEVARLEQKENDELVLIRRRSGILFSERSGHA